MPGARSWQISAGTTDTEGKGGGSKALKIERLLREVKREELIKLTQDLIRIPSVRSQKEGSNEEKVALFLSISWRRWGSMWWWKKWSRVLQMSSLSFRVKVMVPV